MYQYLLLLFFRHQETQVYQEKEATKGFKEILECLEKMENLDHQDNQVTNTNLQISRTQKKILMI